MKTTLLIFLFPIILISQWEKHEKIYINNNQFKGQVRYVPEDNSAIFESKESIIKLDLESGKIVKRIDLDITDTNYIQVVADNDLNNAYVLSSWIDPESGVTADHYIRIENYYSKEVVFEDTVRNVPKPWEHYYQNVNFNLNLLLYKNKLVISYEIEVYSYHENTKTQESKILDLKSQSEAKSVIQTSGLINSYDLINSFGGYAIFGNYYSYMNPKEMEVDRSYTEIYIANLDSLAVYKDKSKDYHSYYKDYKINNSGNNYIYKNYGTSKTKYDRVLPFPSNSTYNFVFFDQFIFYTYPSNGKTFLNITDLTGESLYNDSTSYIMNSTIRFNDGQNFYFLDEDTLKRYTPEYLSNSNLKSNFEFHKDTILYGERLITKNLSSGLPQKTTWLVDNEFISNNVILDYLLELEGTHNVTLISENSFNKDTLTKQVFIKKLKDYNSKKIDFDIEFLDNIPKEIKLTAKGTIDGYEINWNFGDGKVATGNNVKHKYSRMGEYDVTLTAIKDESVIQIVKQDILSLFDNSIDYSINIFEKYKTRGGDRIYIRTHGKMKNINLEILNSEGLSLYTNYYKYLPKGEIIVIDNIGSLDLRIKVTTSEGVQYEY